jgi:hypothetical protein
MLRTSLCYLGHITCFVKCAAFLELYEILFESLAVIQKEIKFLIKRQCTPT